MLRTRGMQHQQSVPLSTNRVYNIGTSNLHLITQSTRWDNLSRWRCCAIRVNVDAHSSLACFVPERFRSISPFRLVDTDRALYTDRAAI